METGAKLEGVTFELLNSSNEKVATGTTNSEGIVEFTNLYAKKYTLKEVSTNDKYLLDNSTKQINLKYNEETTISWTNEIKRGKIKVHKVDSDNHKVVLGNVQFELFSKELNKVIGNYTTDVNGEILIDNLRVGEYTLIEKNTNKFYNLASNTDVEVTWNNTTDVFVYNTLKKGQIRIIKVDKDNHEVKLEGVIFEVLDENENIVQTLITDKNGECETDFLPISIKYKVREIQTKEEYVLNTEAVTVKLEQDQIKTLTFENEIRKGQIKVIKTDGETTYPLKDVEFEIYDSKGNLVDTIKTNEKGEATSKRLSIYDEYKIIETKTRKGYVLNTEEVTNIELKENEITDIKFENYKGKGILKIVKTSSDGVVEGFRFLVKGTIYTGEEYEQEFVTDAEGLIIVEGMLEGKYTITEIRDELACNYEELDSQEIEIKNGETSTAEFYNKLIEIPDTSDDSINFGWILIGLVIIFLGLVYLTFLIRKNVKE